MHINKIPLAMIVCLLLCSCASTEQSSSATTTSTIWDNAGDYAAKGQNKDAWDALKNTPPGLTDRTKQFLQAHPAVYDAGKQEFSVGTLTQLKTDNFQITYVYKRLDDYNLYATKKDQKWAENNIKKVYGNRPVSYAGQSSASSTGTSGNFSNSRFGRVVGVQVVNRSHINTGAGAGLGSLTGQAMYLDNTSWRNYSAMNQIGAGLLGAMVGSALDTPTSIAYERKYWVTLNDGNTVSVSTTGSDNTHIPQGVCVAVTGSSSISPTNESNCKKKT